MAEKIDREKLKDPSEVSGWGPSHKKGDKASQDSSDISKKADVNAEFDPRIGKESLESRGAGPKKK
jgi:hypothetical protein